MTPLVDLALALALTGSAVAGFVMGYEGPGVVSAFSAAVLWSSFVEKVTR